MTAERLYTTDEAAAAMSVSGQTIRRWVEDGLLPAQYVGLRRFIRIEEEDLRKFAAQQQIAFTPRQ